MPLGAGKKWVRPVAAERKRVGGEAMPAASLMALEAGNSLGKGAVQKAAVRLVWKWKR